MLESQHLNVSTHQRRFVECGKHLGLTGHPVNTVRSRNINAQLQANHILAPLTHFVVLAHAITVQQQFQHIARSCIEESADLDEWQVTPVPLIHTALPYVDILFTADRRPRTNGPVVRDSCAGCLFGNKSIRVIHWNESFALVKQQVSAILNQSIQDRFQVLIDGQESTWRYILHVEVTHSHVRANTSQNIHFGWACACRGNSSSGSDRWQH
mmetsp:Transcript_5688/g.9900  ORF Transcript_5688/g.9900 Transcript_5688/m.9900 type:complete len:212 (+) Transcript_5688:426-1061(+)